MSRTHILFICSILLAIAPVVAAFYLPSNPYMGYIGAGIAALAVCLFVMAMYSRQTNQMITGK